MSPQISYIESVAGKLVKKSANVTSNVQSVTASEELDPGDFVNVHNSSGSKVRKANASIPGAEAVGFVLAAVAINDVATVHFFNGINDQVAGQTPGTVFLSAVVPGQATDTAPSAAACKAA